MQSVVDKKMVYRVCVCVCVCVCAFQDPCLLKLGFEEEPLNFHPDDWFFLRGQLLKHFHKVHEIVFIAVLWSFKVCLYSLVTFGRLWLRAHPHRVYGVQFIWLGDDRSHCLAAACSLAALVVWIRDDGYILTVIIDLLWRQQKVFFNEKKIFWVQLQI